MASYMTRLNEWSTYAFAVHSFHYSLRVMSPELWLYPRIEIRFNYAFRRTFNNFVRFLIALPMQSKRVHKCRTSAVKPKTFGFCEPLKNINFCDISRKFGEFIDFSRDIFVLMYDNVIRENDGQWCNDWRKYRRFQPKHVFVGDSRPDQCSLGWFRWPRIGCGQPRCHISGIRRWLRNGVQLQQKL